MVVNRLKYYLKIWWLMAKMAILPDWNQPQAAILFIIGKIARFVFYYVFIFSVLSGTEQLAGYSQAEVIFFFLIFNLVDVTIQFLFRGVYHFRYLVVSGDYDLELVKPLPSFFRPLLGHMDVMDFVTLIPLTGFIIYFVAVHGLLANLGALIMFFLLFISSIVIGFAFHLAVCGVAIITTQIDHLIWVYRDLTEMARFPTDIYNQNLRYILTFAFPVVLLITFPAKALLGLLSWTTVIVTIAVSGFLAFLSLKFWQWSLKQYSSASS
jgi:ABC-2 type transport system permease protein